MNLLKRKFGQMIHLKFETEIHADPIEFGFYLVKKISY